MIFVTVGTHEQQFNRLISYIDKLNLNEEIIMQTGYSTYKPKNYSWKDMFSYKEMTENINRARIIICHAGPSSIMMALQVGKIPIVVPRQKQFAEHVNNHQLEFTKTIYKRNHNIIPIYKIEKLDKIVEDYDKIVNKFYNLNNEIGYGLGIGENIGYEFAKLSFFETGAESGLISLLYQIGIIWGTLFAFLWLKISKRLVGVDNKKFNQITKYILHEGHALYDNVYPKFSVV